MVVGLEKKFHLLSLLFIYFNSVTGDAVHLVKNIRNNLLNGKKFVFPEFVDDAQFHISLNRPAGCKSWGDLLN